MAGEEEEDIVYLLGNKQGSDVVLHLLSKHYNADDPEIPASELCIGLHSEIVQEKSEYFRVSLSDRWAANNPGSSPTKTILRIEDCQEDMAAWQECLRLMYSDTLALKTFGSVREALNILAVSARLVFTDCTEACLKYLTNVAWSTHEEREIRDILETLDIPAPSDLQERLSSSETQEEIESSLKQALLIVLSSSHSSLESFLILKSAIDSMQPGKRVYLLNDPVIISAWRDALVNCLKVIESILQGLNQRFFSSKVRQVYAIEEVTHWILDKGLRFQAGDPLLKVLAGAKGLVQMTIEVSNWVDIGMVFEMLKRIFVIIGNGEAVCSRLGRQGMLFTWIPIVVDYCPHTMVEDLDKSLARALATLPRKDQNPLFELFLRHVGKAPVGSPHIRWSRTSKEFLVWFNKGVLNIKI
ncbi:hypothetical protein SUGI_0233440 [Cryptomeria japonica]|uniref:BTB/POZ domain-containing protein At2g13690 n=1 Tax=Cryptomeria japonica TaxID=3369 RepID=UPI002408B6D9|nr:BTB/POZ domain-containing protein At2g13690 [Cryptomeria japonica]GLJ14436.1 hypothetical protein SUGI_0233440 [Cryptomeria japonica]